MPRPAFIAAVCLLGAAGLAGPSCSTSRYDPPDPVEGAIFPHPDPFDEGGTHGPEALSLGLDLCAECHVLDEGSDELVTPGCASCHEDYPHAAGWRDGTSHGPGLLVEEPTSTLMRCRACHGEDDQGGLTGVGCVQCHPSYPHHRRWQQPQSHGSYVVRRGGTFSCASACHGADLDGGDSGVACHDCHTLYPHEAGWDAGSAHGPSAASLDTCATACHGTDHGGGLSDVSCFQCHGSFPHSSTWSDDHIAQVTQVGEGGCNGCHDPGDGPSGMPGNCAATCHGGQP